LLVLSNLIFAQSNPKQYVGLAVGPSFPIGQFASAELNDSTSGYAKTGIAIEFTYAYRITHNFGVQAIINYDGNGFDYQNYQNQLQMAHEGYEVIVEVTRNWSSGGIMVGPFLTFPISEKLSWDSKALFGLYSAYSPELTLFVRDTLTDNKPEEYIRQSANAYSYSYLFSTGFKYKLSKYYVLLFSEYISSPMKFKDASGWDWDSEPYTTTFNKKISYISVTFGLGYFF
jgi:hypothetical protein